MALRILIADDHAAVRKSIRAVVESHPQWTLCGEAANGREAVEKTRHLKPDVVLIDMNMPELNGLEATRCIAKEVPDTQVLLLTMHQSEELIAEALRAGAQGVVLKSSVDGALTNAIESLSRFAIHLAGRIIGKGRHVGAFFRSKAEEFRVLTPFIIEGLERGEKSLHTVDARHRQVHSDRLREAGVDIDRASAAGQLDIIPWQEFYLQDGRFDPDAVLVKAERLLDQRDGFPLVRLITHMDWATEDPPGVEELPEFEANVNDLFPEHEDVVICVYDLSLFGGDLIVDLIRSHPSVIVGSSLYDNPFYTPADQLVKEFQERRHASNV